MSDIPISKLKSITKKDASYPTQDLSLGWAYSTSLGVRCRFHSKKRVSILCAAVTLIMVLPALRWVCNISTVQALDNLIKRRRIVLKKDVI